MTARDKATTELAHAPAGNRELLAFRVAGQDYCVDVMFIREVRGWTASTNLPQSQSFLRGVINLRGTVLPVVDVSARLGFGVAEPTERHVIIVAVVKNQMVGLMVEAISEILTIREDIIQLTPEVASAEVQNFVSGIFPMDDRLISLLSLDHVMPAAAQAA